MLGSAAEADAGPAERAQASAQPAAPSLTAAAAAGAASGASPPAPVMRLKGHISLRDVQPEPSNPFERSALVGRRSGLYQMLAASLRNKPRLVRAMHLERTQRA